MHLSTHPTSYPTRYQEIAAKLEQELRQHYRCGDYLPAEQQLAARFEVNRHTLRRAIDQLVEKGWVQRRQGVGVLVLMRPFDYPLNAQARFSQNLLDQGYLLITRDKYPVLKISKKIWELQDDSIRVLLRKEAGTQDGGSGPRKKKKVQPELDLPEGFTQEMGAQLFTRLRALRKQLAEQAMVPPFVVFGDRTLRDMCRQLPRTHEQFLQVMGVGQNKDEKYGDPFLEAINGFCEEKGI